MAKKLLFFGLLFLLLGIVMGDTAFAQATAPQTIPTTVTSARGFLDLLNNIVDWIFVVVMIGAVIFIVLAGWQFITGGGDPQAVTAARNKLLYGAIGVIVAVMARGLVAAIRNLVGA